MAERESLPWQPEINARDSEQIDALPRTVRRRIPESGSRVVGVEMKTT